MYVELIFLDNFIMNALVLYLSGRITGANMRVWRLVAACALGGVYAVVALWLLTALQNILIKIAISILMCFIAYGMRCVKQIIALYISSFVFAGACLMLGFTEQATIAFPTPAYRYVLGGALICVLLIEWIVRTRVHSKEYKLEFDYDGHKISLNAMYDSGNSLKDPLSGKGIIVAQKDAILKQAEGLNLSQGVRCFVCNTVSGKALLYAIKPERLTLKAGGKEYSANSYIAITQKPIGGGYNALVGIHTKLSRRSKGEC